MKSYSTIQSQISENEKCLHKSVEQIVDPKKLVLLSEKFIYCEEFTGNPPLITRRGIHSQRSEIEQQAPRIDVVNSATYESLFNLLLANNCQSQDHVDKLADLTPTIVKQSTYSSSIVPDAGVSSQTDYLSGVDQSVSGIISDSMCNDNVVICPSDTSLLRYDAEANVIQRVGDGLDGNHELCLVHQKDNETTCDKKKYNPSCVDGIGEPGIKQHQEKRQGPDINHHPCIGLAVKKSDLIKNALCEFIKPDYKQCIETCTNILSEFRPQYEDDCTDTNVMAHVLLGSCYLMTDLRDMAINEFALASMSSADEIKSCIQALICLARKVSPRIADVPNNES